MSRVLIIGAGGVGSVVTQKCAQIPELFEEICLASRNKDECDAIAAQLSRPIKTAKIDANNIRKLVSLIKSFEPDIVINVALPYQNLDIMEACLRTGVHYLDTANYEVPETNKMEYYQQWDYHDRFKEKGIMALLGCGSAPGMTNVFTAWAKKHHFDEMYSVDIVNCDSGTQEQPFAPHFNPEIHIREVTREGQFYESGEWHDSNALSQSRSFLFPDEIGERNIYMMYHEELESLVKHFPELKRARYWKVFSDTFLNHLRVLNNVGMTSHKPIMHNDQPIIPLQFLKSLLPDSRSLGPLVKGQTCVGCVIHGIQNGVEKSYFVYNVCDHQRSYEEIKVQAVSYAAGVPVMIGALMILTGKWQGAGVYNMEQFDPDPFMRRMTMHGLPWVEVFSDTPIFA